LARCFSFFDLPLSHCAQAFPSFTIFLAGERAMFRNFFFVVFCVVCFASVVGVSQSFAAATQWKVEDGGNGHWYEAIYSDQPVSPNGYQVINGTTVADYSGGITWTAARDAATAKGGWLTDITSEAENTFAYNLIDPNHNSGFWFSEQGLSWCKIGPWIGGFQPAGSPEPGGNWQWVTGSTFTDANGNPTQYTNWYPTTPDNTYQARGIPEDALHFYKHDGDSFTGKWNDIPSWMVTNGYVVESVPEPSTFILICMGAIGLLGFAWRRIRS
jgi:hypothetical protein